MNEGRKIAEAAAALREDIMALINDFAVWNFYCDYGAIHTAS